jgi:hypothetical protein
MAQAEADNTTRAPANDNRTTLQTITRLNENLTNLNDALRAFMAVPADDLRPALERLVDDLITALDAVSGDPDLEPETDEATLGALEGHVSHGGAWQLTVSDVVDDQDLDDSDLEPGADREPSLGACEYHPGSGWYISPTVTSDGTQQAWASSASDDREDEHDGTEPEECFEPWLGSFDRVVNQQHAWLQRWAYGSGTDIELDNADREADEPLLTECADGLEAFR